MKIAYNRIQMIGNKYNRLTVTGYSHTKNKQAFWKCICDCGKEKIITGAALRHNHTKSCGCLKVEHVTDNIEFENGRKSRKLPEGESSFRELFNRYKNSAKKRNLDFRLSRDEFKNLTKQNCNYCNIEPKQKLQKPSNHGNYIYNGIDRKVNSIGYTTENSVTCCGICNEMKMGRSVEEFKQIISKIYKHLDLK